MIRLRDRAAAKRDTSLNPVPLAGHLIFPIRRVDRAARAKLRMKVQVSPRAHKPYKRC